MKKLIHYLLIGALCCITSVAWAQPDVVKKPDIREVTNDKRIKTYYTGMFTPNMSFATKDFKSSFGLNLPFALGLKSIINDKTVLVTALHTAYSTALQKPINALLIGARQIHNRWFGYGVCQKSLISPNYLVGVGVTRTMFAAPDGSLLAIGWWEVDQVKGGDILFCAGMNLQFNSFIVGYGGEKTRRPIE